jgi:hypothetical protein
VARDLLVFQFKLVVDGFKDLALAQVALGAALLDLIRRDGTPGRRFYGIVRLSDRFDRWIDLHEPLARVPDDAPQFTPETSRSVDDVIDGIESSARTVAETGARVTVRGVAAVRGARERGRSGGAAFGGV